MFALAPARGRPVSCKVVKSPAMRILCAFEDKAFVCAGDLLPGRQSQRRLGRSRKALSSPRHTAWVLFKKEEGIIIFLPRQTVSWVGLCVCLFLLGEGVLVHCNSMRTGVYRPVEGIALPLTVLMYSRLP